jgi:hypothetical protein
MTRENPISSRQRDPCNKDRLISQKRPLRPKDVWTIQARLQLVEGRVASCLVAATAWNQLRGLSRVSLRTFVPDFLRELSDCPASVGHRGAKILNRDTRA